jgi:hypothetical protein
MLLGVDEPTFEEGKYYATIIKNGRRKFIFLIMEILIE